MKQCVAVGFSAALAAAGCRGSTADHSVPAASGPDAVAGPTSPAIRSSETSSTASNRSDARGVIFLAVPSGSVPEIVHDAMAPAASERRTLMVYVGASWCEPCQRFHRAAQSGALDGALPRLALLEFDADRDRERLAQAGYRYAYIPLFALASPDGTASPHRVEGAIKGEGAVDFIVPRLRELLARWGRDPGG
jgi:thiol-disulfide isomerase/thioredoxin